MTAQCPVKLYRCCGEGILRCELTAPHPGRMHYAWTPGDPLPMEWP